MEINAAEMLTASAPGAPAKSKKVSDAARDFEALLIAQMLRTARETGSGGWLGSGDDSSSSTALEFAEQQLATLMAQSGGLGLAKMAADAVQKQASVSDQKE